MRLIGHLKESSQAAAFGDFLFLEEIENEIEREDDGAYSVWVEDEECLEDAVRLLAEFERDPGNEKYQGLEAKARRRRTELEEAEVSSRPVSFDAHETVRARRHGTGPLTGALIAMSVVVFVVSRFGENVEAIIPLFIRDFEVHSTGYRWYPSEGLKAVRDGHLWRLVTPIFIHFSFLHILFNMLWLRQLAGSMEHINGRAFLAIFIAVTAAASNLGQYLVSGPIFGGMSGVVFALFGFVWMKSKHDFMSGYAIDQQSVVLMLVWFAVCFTGIMPIANTAHTVGLVIGVAWGYVSARGILRFKG